MMVAVGDVPDMTKPEGGGWPAASFFLRVLSA
jgi:hypothetical protein